MGGIKQAVCPFLQREAPQLLHQQVCQSQRSRALQKQVETLS